MPFTVASGSFTADATPFPTLTTESPAAFRKTPVFETSSSWASAFVSCSRMRSMLRPSASSGPKSVFSAKTWK